MPQVDHLVDVHRLLERAELTYLQHESMGRLTPAACRHNMPLSRAGLSEREEAVHVRCGTGILGRLVSESGRVRLASSKLTWRVNSPRRRY